MTWKVFLIKQDEAGNRVFVTEEKRRRKEWIKAIAKAIADIKEEEKEKSEVKGTIIIEAKNLPPEFL